ncbi:hypothetical protein FF1_023005 [Malus domestica]
MSYYTHAGNEATDFDEYDLTPYGRGYDIYLTFDRSLDPSNETCYLNSSPSDDFDYKRPQFSSYSEPSAYVDEAFEDEYTHYTRPAHRPRPAVGFNPDTPVWNMGLGINEGPKLMSLTPNILGTVGSQSTRRPNRSMDPISE